MKISEFKYNLPKELIAKNPPKKRGTSNLLVLDKRSGDIQYKKYNNIPEYITKGDIVVLNETKVLQCRTFFFTPREKKVEVLFLEERDINKWYCLIGRAKDVNILDILKCKELSIKIEQREGNGFLVSFVIGNSNTLFSKYGHTPLPPYIKREEKKNDKERYNTVFSSILGAVAAPTASLNLTKDILTQIEKKGVKIVKVELKIGWGTFQPIREEDIEKHILHKEYINISKQVADSINKCNGKVWAFGTTVARTLESSYSLKKEKLIPYSGYTDLYIYPGYKWKVVDMLVTNFHMPDSSLILLVSSFAGKENIQKAYKQAIKKQYKFLSYGDSMLIGCNLSK
jgi:S-adenosylmethionine:tRNA ribosyltransferase-isomerase